MKFEVFLYVIVINVVVVEFGACNLSKSDRGKKKNKKIKIAEPSVSTVFERNLVVNKPKQKDIIQESKSYSTVSAGIKNFEGDVLGYVTPWNGHGYDVAKTFGAKFSYISPVWLQVKVNNNNYKIEGGHDIDKQWIKAVKESNKNIAIVPRLLFDGWTGHDYSELFRSKKSLKNLSATILKFVQVNGFDGLVVEIWSQFGGQYKEHLAATLKTLGENFMQLNLSFILVIPPAMYHGNQMGMFLKEDFDRLVNSVTAFSLMTYDYSNVQRPGPNSPITWVRQCVESLVPNKDSDQRRKILLGLNFYGNDYSTTGGGPIIGTQFIDVLSKETVKIQWDDISAEHLMDFKSENGNHVIFYPTLHSIHQRIQLAKELNAGISIWELGQGLDYFYDLF